MQTLNTTFEDVLTQETAGLPATPVLPGRPYADRFDSAMRIVDALGVDLSLDTDMSLLDIEDLAH